MPWFPENDTYGQECDVNSRFVDFLTTLNFCSSWTHQQWIHYFHHEIETATWRPAKLFFLTLNFECCCSWCSTGIGDLTAHVDFECFQIFVLDMTWGPAADPPFRPWRFIAVALGILLGQDSQPWTRKRKQRCFLQTMCPDICFARLK